MSDEKNFDDDPFAEVTDHSVKADEFLQKLDLANEKWSTPQGDSWVFRGHNDATWELIPTLFREWTQDTPPDYEINLINNFIRTVNLVHLPVPTNSLNFITRYGEDSTLRAFSDGKTFDFTHVVFALAQHSGVYTRLLDLTHDPYIAAFFACDSSKLEEKLGLTRDTMAQSFVDCLNHRNNTNQVVRILQEFFAQYTAAKAELPRDVAVWAIRAKSLNGTTLRLLHHSYDEILNLRLQKGLFLLETENYEVNSNSWRAFTDKLTTLIAANGIRKLTLPFDEKDNLRVLLKRKLVSPLYLKPSYEYIAKAVLVLPK